ncbi:MAG: ABC transporter permease [Deltaproteobacteria bacterium]|nr:ABC transporter permease [Deltaproteobacteria bacterium]
MLIPKTVGFLTLIEREYYRFTRLAAQTIAPPVITTLLFILIFGYSLGEKITTIHGFSYILYILPGLAVMGVMTNSFSNSSTSLFMARMDRSIENILVAPLSYFQIVASFVIGGVTRGLVVGIMTLLVAVIMTGMTFHSYAGTIFFLTLIAAIFSSLGIIAALWAEDWDHLATFTNFVITPFLYLGGVFYSIEMLPPFWKKVSYANPIFYLVDGFRRQVLGVSDLPLTYSLGMLLILSLGFFLLAVRLFQKGWKLIQ